MKRMEFDEVLYALARAVGDLAGFFTIDAMKILEDLFVHEETVVREEALKSFIKMLSYISKEELAMQILPNIVQLKTNSLFTGKVASLDLMVAVYPLCQLKDQ